MECPDVLRTNEGDVSTRLQVCHVMVNMECMYCSENGCGGMGVMR